MFHYNHRVGTSSLAAPPVEIASYWPPSAVLRSSDDINDQAYSNPDIISSRDTQVRMLSSSAFSSVPSIPTLDSHHPSLYSTTEFNPSQQFNHKDAPFLRLSAICDTPRIEIDRDLATRNLCVVVLLLGWGISFTALVTGISIIAVGPHQTPPFLMNTLVAIGNINFAFATPRKLGTPTPYVVDHRAYQVSEPVMIILSLFLTFNLTAILDSMSFIHTTSLRWALWRERRSMSNSNMRLFTSSKTHLPNRWPANIVACLALIFSYGGITVLVSNVYIQARLVRNGIHDEPDFEVTGPRYGIDFSAWGLVGLGVGTLLQAIVSTLCLVWNSGLIVTWSSNPLATAKACQWLINNNEVTYTTEMKQMSRSGTWISTGNTTLLKGSSDIFSLAPQSGTLVNAHSLTFPTPHAFSRPRAKQLPARAFVPQTRRIIMFVWILWAAFSLFVIIVAIIAKRSESISDAFVQAATGHLDTLSYIQTLGLISIIYTADPYTQRRGWVGLLIQCFVYSFVLCYLHLVEIITLIIRDEKIWRKATARDGTQVNGSTLLQGSPNWQCWFVTGFKTIIPWAFSYGFSCDMGVFMALIPLAFVAILFLILALFAEGLVRWRPKGSQPATYGNVAALTSLIDDWNHKTLFWGEKSPVADGFGKAGTSGLRLADVKPNELYTRLKADTNPRAHISGPR
jgi:hypothetical protein